jgi:hypothetical protein
MIPNGRGWAGESSLYGAAWDVSTIMDHALNDVQGSYDRVAAEYARRISGELEHKPLDRQPLDRFAARVEGLGHVCDLGCKPGQIARLARKPE